MDSRIPDYFFAQFGIAGLIVLGILAVLFKLSADFAKLRTDLQQEITRDLLNNRLAAYDDLWSRMRGLALYDGDPLNDTKVRLLSSQLSNWYFGKNGGLFLTARTREFYFGLQDVLRFAGRLPDWECAARPTETKKLFEGLVANLTQKHGVAGFRLADLEHPESLNPFAWRDLCNLVGKHLLALGPKNESPSVDAIFAIIQQVSSALRTNLAEGLQTRAEANAPIPWNRIRPIATLGVGSMLSAAYFVALLLAASSPSFKAAVPHPVGQFAFYSVPVIVCGLLQFLLVRARDNGLVQVWPQVLVTAIAAPIFGGVLALFVWFILLSRPM